MTTAQHRAMRRQSIDKAIEELFKEGKITVKQYKRAKQKNAAHKPVNVIKWIVCSILAIVSLMWLLSH